MWFKIIFHIIWIKSHENFNSILYPGLSKFICKHLLMQNGFLKDYASFMILGNLLSSSVKWDIAHLLNGDNSFVIKLKWSSVTTYVV